MVTIRYFLTALVCAIAISSSALAETPKALISESDLLGSWQHLSISKTIDGPAEPLKQAVIHWVFKADGKGGYQQKVARINMDASRPFSWELKNNTILLDKGKVKYTVVKISGEEMIWRNEKLGDYYHLKRESKAK